MKQISHLNHFDKGPIRSIWLPSAGVFFAWMVSAPLCLAQDMPVPIPENNMEMGTRDSAPMWTSSAVLVGLLAGSFAPTLWRGSDRNLLYNPSLTRRNVSLSPQWVNLTSASATALALGSSTWWLSSNDWIQTDDPMSGITVFSTSLAGAMTGLGIPLALGLDGPLVSIAGITGPIIGLGLGAWLAQPSAPNANTIRTAWKLGALSAIAATATLFSLGNIPALAQTEVGFTDAAFGSGLAAAGLSLSLGLANGPFLEPAAPAIDRTLLGASLGLAMGLTAGYMLPGDNRLQMENGVNLRNAAGAFGGLSGALLGGLLALLLSDDSVTQLEDQLAIQAE